MKYKRQLATGMFALALMTTGGTYASAQEAEFANAKINEYKSQIHMKSHTKESGEGSSNKKIKKSRKSFI